MKPQNNEDIRPNRSERRTFCRVASAAALGLWSIRCLTGREESMDKRIKAVTAKVISIKGECGIHKTGDTCTFTETGVQGRVCIHAMYSMLPKVFALMYGAKFPWLNNPDTATHACPDASNPVVFEINRIYE